MVDAGDERAERPAVVDHAADRRAAEVDAVIAALAADQAHLGRVAFDAVVGDGDFERGIDRLRARVGEEDVLEALGRDVDRACEAASKTLSWPIWNVGAKSSVAACFWMASVIFGRQ